MAYCFPPTVHAKQVTMLPHLKYVRQFLAVTLHLHVRVCGREERVGEQTIFKDTDWKISYFVFSVAVSS